MRSPHPWALIALDEKELLNEYSHFFDTFSLKLGELLWTIFCSQGTPKEFSSPSHFFLLPRLLHEGQEEEEERRFEELHMI